MSSGRTQRSALPRRWFCSLSAGCLSVSGLGVRVPVVCAPWGVRCRSTVDSAGRWPLNQQVENLLYGRPRAAWWGERDHEEGVVPCPLEPLPGFGPGGGRLSGGTAVAEPPATFLSPFRAATRSSNAVRRGAVGTSKGVGNEWHCRLRRLSLRRRSSSRLPSGHRNRPHHADATLGPQAPGGGASSRVGGHGD